MDSSEVRSYYLPPAQSYYAPLGPPLQHHPQQLPSVSSLLNSDNPQPPHHSNSTPAEQPHSATFSPGYSVGSSNNSHYTDARHITTRSHDPSYSYGQPRLEPPSATPLYPGHYYGRGSRASHYSIDTSSLQSYSEPSTHPRPSLTSSDAPPTSYGLSPASPDQDTSLFSPRDWRASREYQSDGSYSLASRQGRNNSESAWPSRAQQQQTSTFGVTKAGKPRKRLAEACCYCREKKIRCKPGSDDKCLTCFEKQLDCVKPTDMAPSADMTQSRKRRLPSDEASPTQQSTNLHSSADYHPDTQTPPLHKGMTNGDADNSETKRSRLSPLHESDRAESEPSNRSTSKSQSIAHKPSLPQGEFIDAMKGYSLFEWGQDPYESNPQATQILLDLVFRHRQCGPSVALPEAAFMHWVRNCKDKSDEDRMMLYSVLAIGSLYASTTELKNAGKRYMSIARHGANANFGVFTLQLAQTRVFLSLYMFGVGRVAESYEWIGLGLRALSALKYNLESGVATFRDQSNRSEYGLSEVQTVECRRRTFWAAYLLGRQTGYSTGNSSAVHDEDIFLRLPCTDEEFKNGDLIQTPFLDNTNMDENEIVTAKTTGLGFMALQVMIISIWGQCTGHGYRAVHVSPTAYPDLYDTFYRDLYKRIHIWEAVLPSKLKYSPKNTERALKDGNIEPYFILHSIGCVVAMKANRVAFHKLLSADTIRRNLREARRAADMLLAITRVLDNAVSDQVETDDIESALSQPFPAYCIMSACDIVSRWGLVKNVDETHRQLTAAIQLVSKMATYWHTAEIRRQMIVGQARDLSAARLSSISSQEPPQPFWRQTKPIETSVFTPDNSDDLIFQTPDSVYLETFADLE